MTPDNWMRDTVLRRIERHINNFRVAWMSLRVIASAPQPVQQQPVLFFRASSGIDDLSWNSAFQVLTAWGLRLRGIPVRFLVCNRGMSLCVLGTDRDTPNKKPPCNSCVYQSKSIYLGQPKEWLAYQYDASLDAKLSGISIHQMMDIEHEGVPLGKLVLPGLRWILRRHNLVDDEKTRSIYRKYILSANSIAHETRSALQRVKPACVVVFNGQFFPEATVKFVARQTGFKVYSHEVGLQPMTAFFTEGESTAYPIDIPADLGLDNAQNAKLDAYLEQRFKGNFTMGGVRFWQDIKDLDASLRNKLEQHEKVVPVFTNVIFDTSQPHANTLYSDMFEWLDDVLEAARQNPNTLFIIRAHPDEARLRKSSLETVEQWVRQTGATNLPNVVFIPPDQFISSYELIGKSDFVLIYNSTIGLEATLLGAPVLCAGKARFTQIPTVFFPDSKAEYLAKLQQFLHKGADRVPDQYYQNARKFLYYQLFKSSLPFSEYLDTGIRVTHAKMRAFNPNMLIKSVTIETIFKGLFEKGDFLLKD